MENVENVENIPFEERELVVDERALDRIEISPRIYTNNANSYGYKFINAWRAGDQYTKNEGVFATNKHSWYQMAVTNVSNSTRVGTIYPGEHYVIVGSVHTHCTNSTGTASWVEARQIIVFRNSSGVLDLGILQDDDVYLQNYPGTLTTLEYTQLFLRRAVNLYGKPYPQSTRIDGAGYSQPLKTSWREANNMRILGAYHPVIGGTPGTYYFDSGIASNSMSPNYQEA